MDEPEKVIDKNNPTPLYYQLKELLKSKIENGIYKPEEVIPSERELIDRYGISRTPVRQAINELVSEGFLRKEHGKGTFVAHKKINQMFLENLSSFVDEMARSGLTYNTTVLKKEIVENNSVLEKVFGGTQQFFYKIIRLRFVEKDPYVLVTTYIPASLARGLLEEDLEGNSMYDVLEKNYGFQIKSAKRVIEAVNIEEHDAELLNISPHAAVQMTKTIAYQIDNSPFEYSIALYRGDLNKFTVEVEYKRNQ